MVTIHRKPAVRAVGHRLPVLDLRGGRSVEEAVHQFIAGRLRTGTSADLTPVINPATGDVVENVRLAGPADVDAAVAAARRAFPGWSRAAPVERAEVLTRLAALLAGRADEFARAETRQTGKPIKLSTEFDVPGTVDNVAFFAGAARTLEGRAAGEYSGDHTSYVRREAVGVCGSIAPWNYPLQTAAWKILPAITAGNTEEYTNIKHVMHDLTAAVRKDWHRTIFGDRSDHPQNTAATTEERSS